MTITSTYPVLMSKDVATAAAFYTNTFGFDPTFSTDWYVSLKYDAFELAIVDKDHPTVPEGSNALPAGMLLNIEVDNVDDIYAKVVSGSGLYVVLDIRDEDFGQRHFILTGPDGVLIDVIQPIEPSPEFAAAYGHAPE